MLLLGYIIKNSHIVQLAEIHSISELFLFFFYFLIFIFIFIFNFKCTFHLTYMYFFFFIIKLIKLWKCILFPVYKKKKKISKTLIIQSYLERWFSKNYGITHRKFLFIKKKGDPVDCNSSPCISLINNGLKNLEKKKSSLIESLIMELIKGFIVPEQFGFHNREECISLYTSLRITLFFFFFLFFKKKKCNDSIPIYKYINENSSLWYQR